MFVHILTAIAALLAVRLCQSLLTWRRGILAARAIGLPVIAVPFHDTNDVWRTLHSPVMRLLRLLPARLTHPWIDFMSPIQTWDNKYTLFQRLGSDAFITVSPFGPMFWTADAALIADIAQRADDFPKTLEAYSVLNVYGRNIVTSEGQLWRQHRRIVAPLFGEQNNRMVWEESLQQVEILLEGWAGERTVTALREDMMRLSLYVIAKAGFGKAVTPEVPAGHRLSFAAAMDALAENLMVILLVPPKIMRWLPFRGAYEAYTEWKQYMTELYDDSSEQPGRDLMSAMVRANREDGQLSRDEIMGNAFVLMFAGHETTANAFYFSIIYLAQHPSVQRTIQAELDAIFKGSPPSEWSYDQLPSLLNGRIGASLNEILRIVPSVLDVPKKTRTPQSVVVNGKHYTLPAECYVFLSAAVHHNPRYWPGTDLGKYDPERWMQGEAETRDGTPFRPAKGAFIPFSDGQRSCIGKRFAQVEYAAAMAAILYRCSVELGVDAADEEVDGMGPGERRRVWERARDAAEETLETQMTTVVTTRLKAGAVIPVRFVERGKERFDF